MFVLLPIVLLSGFYTINTMLIDTDFFLLNKVDAQILPQSNPIEILSTSSYTDDFGNFHIVGEVNNTSFQPKSSVVVGSLLYNMTTNELIGNYSALISLETLRTGEVSPFHIIVDDPNVLGNFDYIDFFTSSQDGQAKPANLVLNVTNKYVDEIENPHIAGNIINQGNFPEQFANLIATYYDNSSQGVIGTETFGVDLGNISQGQLAWFDLGITDNRTKNQAHFFALSVESNQSSMDYPINIKRPILTTNDPLGNSATSSLFGDPLIGSNQVFSNNDNIDNNIGQSFSPSSNSGSGSGSTNNDSPNTSENFDLDVDILVEEDPLVRGNDQTIEVTVSDADTEEKIQGADTDLRVSYTTEFDKSYNDQTNSDGLAVFQFLIGPNSNPGIFDVTVRVNADGYDTVVEQENFEVIEDDDSNIEDNQSNDTNTSNNITGSNDESQGDNNVDDNGLPDQDGSQSQSDDNSSSEDSSDPDTSSESNNNNNDGDDSSNNNGDESNGDENDIDE